MDSYLARLNIGPRLGFAWDFTGNGRTILRGGGSVIYVMASHPRPESN